MPSETRPSSRRAALAGTALAMALTASPGQAQPVDARPLVAEESALKAAFLYNFVLLTRWPAAAGAELTICVLGRETLGPALEALEQKSPGGRRVKTLRLADASASPSHCELLYLGSTRSAGARELLARVEPLPVLTVADDDTPADPSPTIVLERSGSRMAFDIRVSQARARGLELDPKLLRLARQVK